MRLLGRDTRGNLYPLSPGDRGQKDRDTRASAVLNAAAVVQLCPRRNQDRRNEGGNRRAVNKKSRSLRVYTSYCVRFTAVIQARVRYEQKVSLLARADKSPSKPLSRCGYRRAENASVIVILSRAALAVRRRLQTRAAHVRLIAPPLLARLSRGHRARPDESTREREDALIAMSAARVYASCRRDVYTISTTLSRVA